MLCFSFFYFTGFIRYISDMPKTKFLSRSDKEHSPDTEESSPHVLQVYKDCDSDEEHSTEYRSHQLSHHDPRNVLRNVSGNDILQGGRLKESVGGRHSKSRSASDIAAAVSSTGGFDSAIHHRNAQSQSHSSLSLARTASPSLSSLQSSSNNSNKNNKITSTNAKNAKKGINNNTEGNQSHLRIISAKRQDSCFFCLKAGPQLLVPACIGWLPHPLADPGSSGSVLFSVIFC